MKKQLHEILRLVGGLTALYDQLNDKILFDLRRKSIAQLKIELKNDPPDVLQHVFEIAFDAQEFEICEAVKQLQGYGLPLEDGLKP